MYVVNRLVLGRDFLRVFAFPLSVSFHKSSILIFIYMLLVRQGQMGEAWRPTYQALDSKVGLLSFLMLQKLDCDAFQ